MENYESNYQIPQFIEYAFKVHNELNLVQRKFYNKAQHLQTLGLDIVEVNTCVQVWKLEYQQDELQFNGVKYWHVT